MTTKFHDAVIRGLIPLALFVACVLLQPACGGGAASDTPASSTSAAPHGWKKASEDPSPTPPSRDVTCPDLGSTAIPGPLPRAASAPVGTLPGAFAISSTGEATYSLPIVVPPGRAGMEPQLGIVYDSAAGEGVLGMGFTVSGLSAITRCPQTILDDGQVRGVRDAPDDAFCLDGKRLVPVGGGERSVEYRTFPDTFAKVVARLDTGAQKGQPRSFDIYTRAGLHVEYGSTDDSRAVGTGGVPRSWWAAKSIDRRGNYIAYSYVSERDADGHTLEMAPSEIRYTGFDGASALAPTRAVRFHYRDKGPGQLHIAYSRGVALRSWWRLSSIEMLAPGAVKVRDVRFRYGFGPGTKRLRLEAVQECAADDVCKPATRFGYSGGAPGFTAMKTGIAVPYAAKASPMLLDVTGDGRDDMVIPDLVDVNDPATAGIIGASGVVSTYWNLARSAGQAAPKVFGAAASARRSDSIAVSLPADTKQVQPELGTALDYDQDGRTDLFLHDVHANDRTWFVLLAHADGTFARHDTGIARPVPAFHAMPDMRDKDGSVHIADVDGDGVPDFIQCENANQTGMGTNDYRWALHPWRPEVAGWEVAGAEVAQLGGYPCNAEMYTVDVDADGRVDLVVPGAHRVGGQLVFHATYVALSWDGGSAWTSVETGLPGSPQGRLMFLDANGDGLPDAIEADQAHQLVTYFNTGKGFAAPAPSLAAPVVGGADRFFGLAAPIDYNGDGRRDLLIPLPNGDGALPSWVVLLSTGSVSGATFTVVDPHIPFEASLSENGIKIADPRGPRVADVDGDGAQDVVIALAGFYTAFRSRVPDQDLLTAVADGMNEGDLGAAGFVPSVNVVYDHLTDGTITDDVPVGSAHREKYGYVSRHDATNGCVYPVHCVVGPRRVVHRYGLNNGADRLRGFEVKYRDGRFHRLGRGFLGFGERVVTDLDTHASTAYFYDNVSFEEGVKAFPYAGQVVREEHGSPGLPGQPDPLFMELSFSDVTYETVPTNGGKTYFTIPKTRHTRREQGMYPSPSFPGLSVQQYVEHVAAADDAIMLSESYATIWSHDTYGNVLDESTMTVGLDMLNNVQRTFTNDADRWILGQVKEQTECSWVAGEAQCRVTSRRYDATGLLREESTSSDDADPLARAETQIAVGFGRDMYGNVVTTVAEDAYGKRRSSCVAYDGERVFPWAHVNAAGHATYMRYDAAFGVPTVAVDPNGLYTRWAYDGFGRLAEEVRPVGNKTTYLRKAGSKLDGFAATLETKVDGGGDDVTQYDKRGRAIRWTSQPPRPAGSSGPGVAQEIEFDDLGEHVARRSVPHADTLPDGQRRFDRFTYDALGRVATHTTPWNATTSYSHDGPNVVTYAPLGVVTVLHHDGLGRPLVVTDAEKGTTSYTYGPFGSLRSVTDPGGAVTVTHADAYGRVKRLVDPDRGTSVSTYDGFGEMVSTTDALGRETTLTYDALGRTLKRLDADGPTAWTWDQADKGIGRLASVTSPGGHVEAFTYDALSRLQTTTLAVAGPNGSENFVTHVGYDGFGRVGTVVYPREANQAPFAVKHEYDAHGHLLAVRDAITSALYWSLTEVDGAGRTREETFGNGVTTTRTYHATKGVLSAITTSGAEEVQDLLYVYDDRLNLTRRRDARLSRLPQWEGFTYDGLDRLRCVKTHGAEGCTRWYEYGPSGNIATKSDAGAYRYDDPAHPHAVTSVLGAQLGAYEYDAIGNQIARSGAAVTYTAFDLPRTVGGATLDYDGSQRRIRKTTASAETIYVGGLFERVTPSAGGPVERRYYIHSPERAVAVVTRVGAAPGVAVYLHTDSLGSTDAVTNATGKVVEQRTYDAFGARMGAAWSALPGAFKPATTRGFTGHEGDEDLGLVNMKGRVYDPKLGRFLTPDPIVSRPLSGQSWNPYSYVVNNPLKYVDPSGFDYTEPEPGHFVFSDDRVEGKAPSSPGTTTVGPPPEKSGEEKPQDISQAMAAGAARLPTDTGTLGTSSGDAPQQKASFGDDALTAAGAFTRALVGPLARGYVQQLADPLSALGEVGSAIRVAQGVANATFATGAALWRGDKEGAAVEAGTRLPVSSGILALTAAAKEGLDDWEAGNRAPAVIGRTWGRITAGAIGVVGGVATVVGGVGAVGAGVRGAAGGAGRGSLGDLTLVEIEQIQGVVDQAGRPLEVVGSAATGTRRGVGSGSPIGKGPGTRSDIDFLAPPSSHPYFKGLEGGLPSLDPATGLIPGTHNRHIGPAVRFEPGAVPYFVPAAP